MSQTAPRIRRRKASTNEVNVCRVDMVALGRPRNHDPIADEIRQVIQFATLRDVKRSVTKSTVDVLDGEARSPLLHAAREGKKEIVEWRLDAGANVSNQDLQGMSALHYAVEGKHRAVVEVLLSHGLTVDLRDRRDNTPL